MMQKMSPCSPFCTNFRDLIRIFTGGLDNLSSKLSIVTSYYPSGENEQLSSATINCDSVSACDLTCTDVHQNCYGITINAENADQLVVTCSGPAAGYKYVCDGMHMYCPKTNPRCWLFADGGDPGVNLQNINIYAELGFDGVEICAGDVSFPSIGIMNCGSSPGYSTTCNIDGTGLNACTAPTATVPTIDNHSTTWETLTTNL